jgi:RHS repeat-associated protein
MADKQAQDSFVSPPSGIGSSPGLGEAFKMNLNTGQGTYTYKLQIPAGIGDYTPKLALEYTHGARLDIFGFGWRLPLRMITRRLELGELDADREIFLDGSAEIAERLDGTYAARQETTFARYTRVAGGWKIEDRNGGVHTLGASAATRVQDPDRPERILDYLIERSEDAAGNDIRYRWTIEGNYAYPAEIAYAAYALRFVYENRPDPRTDCRGGFLRDITKRCARIDLFLDPGPGETRIRSWVLTYDATGLNGASLLTSIQMTSFDAGGNAANNVVRRPVRFSYGTFNPSRRSVRYFDAATTHPPGLDDDRAAIVNMDDGPLPGVLTVINGKQFYWRNNGRGGWDAPRQLPPAPLSGSLNKRGVALADMTASGRADLMLLSSDSPIRGYYENEAAGGWGRFVAYDRASTVNPEWSSPQLRITDNDGDGKLDAIESTPRAFVVWRNRAEDGWAAPRLVPKPTTPDAPDVDFSDPTVLFADMNGDGLDDIVRLRSGAVEYWPNLGDGRYGARVTMSHSPRLPDMVQNPRNTVLLDVDGDGCADLAHVDGDAITVWINRNGRAFADPIVLDPIPTPLRGTVRALNAFGKPAAGLVWNSLRAGHVRYVHLDFDADLSAYLLTGVDNGSGLIAELHYRPAVEDYLADRDRGIPWHTNFPFPLTVVASTKETDTVTGQVTEVQYRYHEAHYERHRRQFQGFRRTELIEKGNASRPDTSTIFEFLQGQEFVQGNRIEHAALNGNLARTEVYQLDGSPLASRPYSVEIADYTVDLLNDTVDGEARAFLHVTRNRTEDRERTDDVRVEEKTYTYDNRGNVVREVLRASGTKAGLLQPELVHTTDVTYAVSNTRYLVDRHASVVVRDGANRILSETRFFYDGPAFVGLPLGQATRGQLTREAKLIQSEAAFAAHYAGMDAAALGYRAEADADGVASRWADTKRYTRDPRGLVIAERDPVGNERSFQYEASGLFRTRLTNPLGVTRFDYARAIGQPLAITYGDGAIARFTYDAQGRVLTAMVPDDDPARPARSYEYDDTVVPHRRVLHLHAKRDGTAPSEVLTYFTGRGEEFQHRAQVSANEYVVSGTRVYNPWGDLEREFEPTFSPDRTFDLAATLGRPSREIQYDARGRVVHTVHFNGGISTADYRPFSVTLFDANDSDTSPANVARGQANTPKREELDVFRQRVRVVELLGGGQEYAVHFDVDSAGRYTGIQDDAGSLCTYTYDLAGNRLTVNHRAAGTRSLWYNAKGQVVRSLDANGHDLRVEYDALGRNRRLLINGGGLLEDYTYDDLARNAFGRLAQVTYSGGMQAFRYDRAGRVVQKETTFGGGASHSIDYEYDYLGRELAEVHTGGIRIEKSLTMNGWVRAIGGVLSNVTYNPRGLPDRVEYANGVATDFTYLEGPGRVTRQRTTGPGAQVYEDVTCDLDRMGLLLSMNDVASVGNGGASGLTSFTYDPLYQVRSFTADDGAGPQTRQYDYANRLNLSRIPEADALLHFDDPAFPDRIHGITQGANPRQNVTYDANGNLLTLPGKTFTYDEKNNIATFTASSGVTATYLYDHEGFRTEKVVNDGHGGVTRTLFVAREVEIRGGGGAPAVFVTLGGKRVAIVRAARTDFVHTDYAGSTSFFTDAAGTKIAAIAYRPFGNVARSNGAVDDRTYGSHPFDAESGLFYMKRRYYAPEIGRFLTPDPLALYQPQKFASNPKALHPYAYAGNDPLNHIDPDGLSFWSVLGAVVGVIVGVALAVAAVALIVMTGGAAAVLIGIAAALIGAGIVAGSYAIANANRGTGLGEFFRGFMIGFNAGANAVIATVLFGPVVGVALGVINFLAAFDTIAGNRVFQGILGWSSWLMPMTWLVTGIGLVMYVINLIVAGVTLNSWAPARISSLSIDWSTGTLVMTGGLIRSGGSSPAFNMGHFVFLKPGSTDLQHELGHTLSLAAYGWAFHYVGAIDENVTGGGSTAFAEVLADSHDPTRAPGPGSSLDQWDPAHTGAGW